MSGAFGETQPPSPSSPVSYTAFNGAFFGATPTYPEPDDDYLAAHELGNALGLEDYYATSETWTIAAQFSNADYTMAAGVTMNAAHNQPYAYYNPVGPQLLDIEALQYLYGVNPNGYTPSYVNTAATLSGSTLTYKITDISAPETRSGSASMSPRSNFSACTTGVAINLNAASFSSNYIGAARYGDVSGEDESIGIAVGTVFNLGIGNNLGDSLIADVTAGNNDILVGGNGDDSFVAGRASDIFIGAGGTDSVLFHDARSNYIITAISPGVILVTDDATDATDSDIPTLSISAAQAASDAAVLSDLTGSFTVAQSAAAGNQSISGIANALGNIVIFSGQASRYTITAAGDGKAALPPIIRP